MPSARTPYERDFLLWTMEQAAELRRIAGEGRSGGLDLPSLAEEIEGLGIELVAVVEGLTSQILVHLLRLEHSTAEAPRLSWCEQVLAWRAAVDSRLRRAPRVREEIDLAGLYGRARRRAVLALFHDGVRGEALPDACPYDLDQVWGDWFPANRHGIVDPV
jgi:hypothetical protein